MNVGSGNGDAHAPCGSCSGRGWVRLGSSRVDDPYPECGGCNGHGWLHLSEVPGRPLERAALYEAAHDAYHEAREQGVVVVGDLARLMTDAVLACLEQVGWLEDADTNDPAPVKMKHGEAFYAGDVGVCVPLYRLPAGNVGINPLEGAT